ncbi:MAG: DUF202 domain-containing protein [Pirellulaceae bacterium]
MSSEKEKLIVRDWLAIERTKLANERTFLSYFRTGAVLLGTGLALIKVEMLSDLAWLGIVMTVLSPFVFVTGIYRFFRVQRNIRRHYND